MSISLAVIQMIRLSENVLASSMSLLKRLESYHFSSLSELAYSKIAAIASEDLFVFAQNCGWVYESNRTPTLTERGAELLQLQEHGQQIELKRQMLIDYVLRAAPIWTNRIPYGRSEARVFMSKDEKACFSEAGLFTDQLDSSIVEWWDTIANQIRTQSQLTKTDIGRNGELNSIAYERIRTDADPVWMSVDSNLAGYDIKSRLSKDDPETLLIEVKTSSLAINDAVFHVTSHEWEVALTSPAYVFHLWCLINQTKLLAILSPNDVQPYIPTNQLEGEWESAKIPFSCFESYFIEIE